MSKSIIKTFFTRAFFLIFFASPFILSAQSSSEVKNIFIQADSYLIYEEYELANQLFLMIDVPENKNIKYKIGKCYLNIPGEKEKSIQYLEEAVKTADINSKPDSYKEIKAPLDIYFFLAKAYMINNEFDKALNTFEEFTKLATETNAKNEMENFDYVQQQIQACKNAILFTKVPSSFSKEALGDAIGVGAIIENPAVSYDGNTLIYTERRGIENALFFSRKKMGQWQNAIEITSELKAGTDCSSCSLNNDGTELFLYKTDNYDGAIYSSRYLNGTWTPIKKLNKNINTKFYESHASISSDGSKLYFTSNRDGGLGNLDIYVSEKDKAGDWGPAKNLGPEINTPYNEDTPFITANDSLLYFSSEGHNSMGGYDIYKCRRKTSGWGPPSNLGYPVNSADDDKFFQPSNNGNNAFYSITTDYKKKGIFYLDMIKTQIKPSIKISGMLTLNDTTIFQEKRASVDLINKISGDTLYRVVPENGSGTYSAEITPGLYSILFRCEDYYPSTVDTIVAQDNNMKPFVLNMMLFRDSTSIALTEPVKYEKLDFKDIPSVASIDSSILITDLVVNDETDKNIMDSDVLYFTVQVMALHKPVDVNYFKYINDMKVLYNDKDRFYRFTTGKFLNKKEAYALRAVLIKKGYPEQIFVKKVSK